MVFVEGNAYALIGAQLLLSDGGDAELFKMLEDDHREDGCFVPFLGRKEFTTHMWIPYVLAATFGSGARKRGCDVFVSTTQKWLYTPLITF